MDIKKYCDTEIMHSNVFEYT